jgi:hypothetical protein
LTIIVLIEGKIGEKFHQALEIGFGHVSNVAWKQITSMGKSTLFISLMCAYMRT